MLVSVVCVYTGSVICFGLFSFDLRRAAATKRELILRQQRGEVEEVEMVECYWSIVDGSVHKCGWKNGAWGYVGYVEGYGGEVG